MSYFCFAEKDEFKDMFSKMQDKKFMAQFPLLSALLNQSQADDDGSGLEKVKKMLMSCGFKEFVTLLGNHTSVCTILRSI